MKPVVMDIPVFARIVGGMVDLICRADTEELAIQGMIAQAILVQDEETGEVRRSKGVEVTPIGSVTVKPAVYDEEDNLITEAVVDSRHHFNLRIRGQALLVESENFPGLKAWEETAYVWTAYGEDDPNQNAHEVGRNIGGITLIDPDTIVSPKRVAV